MVSHNFLRSDPHYCGYQFSKSIDLAVGRGDLATVEWLLAHFSGCTVSEDLVAIAAERGDLATLKFLLANGAGHEDEDDTSLKKRKVQTSRGVVKAESTRQADGNTVLWGPEVIMTAMKNDQLDVVRWLHEHMPDENNDRDREREIRVSLRSGGDELAQFLMPRGRCILDYAHCSNVWMVELLLDCGYIQRDIGLANSAVESLAQLGRLDLMQRVVLVHSPPRENSPLCMHSWWRAITRACEEGYLEMLKWLLDHPLGEELRQNMRPHQKYSYLVRLAGQNDQPEVMQYLYEQGAVEEINDDLVVSAYAQTLTIAIRDDRYNTVKWLVENIQFPDDGRPGDIAIEVAARCRRFNILKLFHELGSTGVVDLSQNEDNQAGQVATWWSRSRHALDSAGGSGMVDRFKWLVANHPNHVSKESMDGAAYCGNLEMVQWLHANRSEGCTVDAMDGAASWGHLKVVKWHHANRSEGCTKAAMDGAGAHGHLEIVKWLHANRSEGCRTKAMNKAAACGHLEVIKWLASNRIEGCSAEAIQNAVDAGHVAVLDWLHQHFPDYYPTAIDIAVESENIFEVLLFLHQHHPQVITPEFSKKARQYYMSPGGYAWLADNCGE
jgi:hypothetical protein